MKSHFTLLVLALTQSACETPYPQPRVEITEPSYAIAQLTPTIASNSNGAIYQAASYRPLFEDHRARIVGDTITVQIVEKVSATQKSTSGIEKSGSVSAGLSAVPLLPPSILGRMNATGNTGLSSAGKGSNENTNEFSGTIAAVVTGVLPNGHLVIAGEKQIGVNHNVDVLRFSGQVDPRAIQPGNTIASSNIANVRLEQRGRGATADTHGIGWLSRFFLNLLPI